MNFWKQTIGRLAAALIVMASTSLIAADLVVDVSTNDDQSTIGVLRSIDEAGVTIANDGSQRTIAMEQMQTLVPTPPNTATGPAYRVRLRDGSIVAAQGVATSKEQLVIEPRRQEDLRVPLRQVLSIRFKKASPATDPKWLGLFETEGRGDVIAVRRDGNVIDSIRAVVLGIEDDTVKIDLGGNVTAAPISKLEGIIFAGNDTADESTKTTLVRDVYGSQWKAVSLTLDSGADALHVELSNGTHHSFPLEQIERIQWAGGAVKLATLTAAEQTYDNNPGFNANSSEIQGLVNRWVGPRNADDADLLMPGGSALEYRAESEAATLRGSVRRERGVFRGGKVIVRVSMDGNTAWEQELVSADPLGFEVPIENASRIRLEVDASDDGDAGDLVRWVNPRMVK